MYAEKDSNRVETSGDITSHLFHEQCDNLPHHRSKEIRTLLARYEKEITQKEVLPAHCVEQGEMLAPEQFLERETNIALLCSVRYYNEC